MKVLVTTYPFNAPIYGCEVFYNTKKSKYTQDEIRERIKEVNPDIIIAGTEKYTSIEFDLNGKLESLLQKREILDRSCLLNSFFRCSLPAHKRLKERSQA